METECLNITCWSIQHTRGEEGRCHTHWARYNQVHGSHGTPRPPRCQLTLHLCILCSCSLLTAIISLSPRLWSFESGTLAALWVLTGGSGMTHLQGTCGRLGLDTLACVHVGAPHLSAAGAALKTPHFHTLLPCFICRMLLFGLRRFVGEKGQRVLMKMKVAEGKYMHRNNKCGLPVSHCARHLLKPGHRRSNASAKPQGHKGGDVFAI